MSRAPVTPAFGSFGSFGVAPARLDDDAPALHRWSAPDRLHRRRGVHAFPERFHQALDVARRAAADGAPHRPVVHRQHAVVGQEADEEPRREVQHALRIGGPDGRAHRHEVVVDEAPAVAALLEEGAQRQFVARGLQQRRRLAVEAQDLRDHAEEARAGEIAPLREEAVEVDLLVIIDAEVPVALAALEVHAHEEPAYVARETRIIGVLLADLVQPPRGEEARAAQLLILEVRPENLARHLVPRLVRAERRGEILAPLVAVAVAFHELDVEGLGQLLGELGRGRQPFQQLGAFVRRLVREEFPRLLGTGNRAGEVKPRAAQELAVVRRDGERLLGGLGFRGDELVHLLVQRRRGRGRDGQPDGAKAHAAQRQAAEGGLAHGYWTHEASGTLNARSRS